MPILEPVSHRLMGTRVAGARDLAQSTCLSPPFKAQFVLGRLGHPLLDNLVGQRAVEFGKVVIVRLISG